MSLTVLLSQVAGNGGDVIYYVLAGLLSVLVLLSISRMSRVETAVGGNLGGALLMLLAVVLTLWYYGIFSIWQLWVGMLLGTLFGVLLAIRVKMIQMPQMVGLLNGFGGAASMIAGLLTLVTEPNADAFTAFTAALAIVVGALTFSGSLVAAGKLQQMLPQKPIVLRRHPLWTGISLALAGLPMIGLAIPGLGSGLRLLFLLFTSVFGLLFGVLFAIRVGGADMPITISLLNSFSGVAGSIAGLALADPLLVAVGGIVGASGLLLTQIMCRSMNRRLFDILLGRTSTSAAAPVKKTATVTEETVTEEVGSQESGFAGGKTEEKEAAELSPPVQVAEALRQARRILIVPGYGMALSQAQASVKQLVEALEKDGRDVRFAIHPVAGRMPGHMNVLLAEVDIPYDQLYEMEAINDEFKDTDVALVIGANDVVNPAANTAEGTPIYGMPILNVDQARSVVMLNYDTKPGYAGVDNPLYDDKTGQVLLCLGDAREQLGEILVSLQQGAAEKPVAPVSDADHNPVSWLAAAESVVVVPGYGMALAQAQQTVKQLADLLEARGKKVRYAIHPVAGRMPGHMNVLLAEVDVPYDQLYEMDNINAEFQDTDVVLVVGANDVLNPAANTAEGTPIYGMPILNVEAARRIIICNLDTRPGYAGVDNPLYEDDPAHTQLCLGNARETLAELLRALELERLGAAAGTPARAALADAVDHNPVTWLKKAESVIIVPGYGMALSQAQGTVKQVADLLERSGKTVRYAIHPVAGRMPGHMNVLLAEVDVPYDQLYEMETIDDDFQHTDLALVIGANDVVNPAANTAEGTPIYGMPILNVEAARHILICNYDDKPGYAGVPNPLYEDDPAHTQVCYGDAKKTLTELLRKLASDD